MKKKIFQKRFCVWDCLLCCTAQKNGDILKIYKGDGLVVATKLNEEWVTLLEDGKGMAIQFEQFKIVK